MGRTVCDFAERGALHKLHYGSGLPVFRGEFRQRGYGLGGVLGNLARFVLPALKPLGKALLRKGVRTTAAIASDVISGKRSFKSAARKRVSDALSDAAKIKRVKRRKKDIFA